MARKKLTALEQQVWDLWDELAFRDGGFAGKPLSREELTRRERQFVPEWDGLFAKAYSDNEWKVGIFVATTISNSRWHRRMILAEYGEAEAEIARLTSHPDWAKADRSDKATAPIFTYLARMGQGDFVEACVALQKWIQDGPYRRSVMAAHTVLNLTSLLSDLPERPATPVFIDLVTELCAARRAPKKLIRACAEIKSTREATDCLSDAMGWTR